MQGRLAEPLSRKQIRNIALAIRKIVGAENKLYFPIVEFLELILPQIMPSFQFIIETEEMMGSCHGLTYPEHKIIKIREDVYDRAVNGSGRDRLTLAHELFHLLQHSNDNISFARIGDNSKVVTYCDPEWQADAFGGELLIPKHLIGNMSVDEIVANCDVSYSAAKYQKSCY